MKVEIKGLKFLDPAFVCAIIAGMEEGDMLAYGTFLELKNIVTDSNFGTDPDESREVQAISDIISGMLATNTNIGVCLFEDDGVHFHFGCGDFEYSFNPSGCCDYDDNFPMGYIKIVRA